MFDSFSTSCTIKTMILTSQVITWMSRGFPRKLQASEFANHQNCIGLPQTVCLTFIYHVLINRHPFISFIRCKYFYSLVYGEQINKQNLRGEKESDDPGSDA
jgi:hypothetical protein